MGLIVIANMNSQNVLNANSPIKILSFCVECPSPEIEGSLAFALPPKYGLLDFFITAEVVYCIPNYADQNRIINKHQFKDRIVFVNRGINALLDKVARLQGAGAAAVLIGDDGQCDENFKNCGNRAGSAEQGGFSAFDDEMKWREITIPVLLISATSAQRLRDAMQVQRMSIPKLGFQNVTVLRNLITGEAEL